MCLFIHKADLQITQQPQSNTRIKYRETVALTVSATGAENLFYTWKKDGTFISRNKYDGINTANLTISQFLPDEQGKYSCVIKNCNASIESEQADLALGIFISTVYTEVPFHYNYL